MITINNMCYFYTEHTEWQYYTFLSSLAEDSLRDVLSARFIKQPRKYLKSASLLETVMITCALLCIACILEFLLVGAGAHIALKLDWFYK